MKNILEDVVLNLGKDLHEYRVSSLSLQESKNFQSKKYDQETQEILFVGFIVDWIVEDQLRFSNVTLQKD